MNYIFFSLVLLILNIYLFKYLLHKRRKVAKLKAGRKWDLIVDELRRRK